MAYALLKDYYEQNIRTLQYLCTDLVLNQFQQCYETSKPKPLDRDLEVAAITTNEAFYKRLAGLQFPPTLIKEFIYLPLREFPRPFSQTIEVVDVCELIKETLNLHRDLRVCMKAGYTETAKKSSEAVFQYLTNLMYLAKNHFVQNPFVFDEFATTSAQVRNYAVRIELVHKSIREAIELSNACTYKTSSCENEANIVDVLKAELLHSVRDSNEKLQATETLEAEQWKCEQDKTELKEIRAEESKDRYLWRERVVTLLESQHETAQVHTSHMQEMYGHIGSLQKSMKSMNEKLLIQMKELNSAASLQGQNELLSAHHQTLVQGLEQGFNNLTMLNRRLFDECKFISAGSRQYPPQMKPVQMKPLQTKSPQYSQQQCFQAPPNATNTNTQECATESPEMQYTNTRLHVEQLVHTHPLQHNHMEQTSTSSQQNQLQALPVETQQQQQQQQQQQPQEQHQQPQPQEQHQQQPRVNPTSHQSACSQPAPISQHVRAGVSHPQVLTQAQVVIPQRDLQPQSTLQSTSILNTPYEHLPYPSFQKMQHAHTTGIVPGGSADESRSIQPRSVVTNHHHDVLAAIVS